MCASRPTRASSVVRASSCASRRALAFAQVHACGRESPLESITSCGGGGAELRDSHSLKSQLLPWRGRGSGKEAASWLRARVQVSPLMKVSQLSLPWWWKRCSYEDFEGALSMSTSDACIPNYASQPWEGSVLKSSWT